MDKKINIILFDEDKTTKTLIENYLSELNFDYCFAQYNHFDEKIIENSNSNNIIIVCINLSNLKILKVIEVLSKNKRNNFFIISSDKSTDISVKALRAGAKDFMSKPPEKTDFIYKIKKIYQTNIMKNNNEKKSIINTVISADKSTGKTSFIINLAEELASISKEKVLVVDFNNAINDVSMLLSLDIEYNLPWMLKNLNENNGKEILEKALQYKNTSMYVASSGLLGIKKMPSDKSKIEYFFEQAKKYYKYIFVDLSPDVDQDINEFITKKLSNYIYILFNPSSFSAEHVKPLLSVDMLIKFPRIILNKYNEKSKSKLQEYEKIISQEIFWKIPNRLLSSMGSAKNRTTLKEVNSEMDIVQSYKKLAEYIINRD